MYNSDLLFEPLKRKYKRDEVIVTGGVVCTEIQNRPIGRMV